MSIEYKDVSSFGKRSYALIGDEILVRAVTISGSEHEVRLALHQLDPNYESMRVRGPLFVPLVFVALIGITGVSILSSVSSLSHITYPYYACLFMGAFGLIFGALSLRRTRLVRFKNLSGVPAFDVFEAGPEKTRFDSFVAGIQDKIKERKPNPEGRRTTRGM